MEYHLIATFGNSRPSVKVALTLDKACMLAEEAVERGANLQVSYVENENHRLQNGQIFLARNGYSVRS